VRSLVFLLLLLPCGLGRGDGEDETIPQIQVTHAWGDLLATPPIAVESDQIIYPAPPSAVPGQPAQVRVWVGIDQDRPTTNSAVLLYCLVKGVRFYGTSDEDLGPFQVQVKGPGVKMALSLEKRRDALAQDFRDSTFVLFTRSVPLAGPGKYVIRLVQTFRPTPSAAPKIVAKIELYVAGNPVLPWSPWASSTEQSQGVYPPGEEGYLLTVVSNPSGGIAVPKARQDPLTYAEAPNGTAPLPQLIPDQPDPQTQLQMTGDTLTVKLPGSYEQFEPQEHFLTRWWVNDEPHLPDPTLNAYEWSNGEGGGAQLAVGPTVFHFGLDFRPERLGAKKGDKIGVQLLFCPERWQFCGDQPKLLQDVLQERDTPPPANFSFPSNRIDFIYSGDPKNPQQ
jgi:hypothetical protein